LWTNCNSGDEKEQRRAPDARGICTSKGHLLHVLAGGGQMWQQAVEMDEKEYASVRDGSVLKRIQSFFFFFGKRFICSTIHGDIYYYR
jgi:hypothetical protein